MSPAITTYFTWPASWRRFSLPCLPFSQRTNRLKASRMKSLLPTCRSDINAACTGVGAFCGVFCGMSGQMKSSAIRRLFLTFMQLMQIT